MNIKDLTAIGLSEKEAQVYLALLELGKDTVQHISNKSGVNRATTYFILDSLLKQGLASTFEQGKKTFYAAEPPHELIKILQKQESELARKQELFDDILPELKSIYNLADEKPTVRFYEGKEGLKAMQDHFLNSGAEDLLEVYPIEHVIEVFSSDERSGQTIARKSRKIDSKVIVSTAKPIEEVKKESFNRETPGDNRVFISQKDFPVTADISIFNDIVAIASLKGKLSGVVIESKEVANTLRSLFHLAYKGIEKEEKENN